MELRKAEGDAQPDIEQVLTFHLGDQEYAIDILHVQEIRRYQGVTPMPGSPGYVCGSMEFRGELVAVHDLAASLGVGCSTPNKTSVIIVVRPNDGGPSGPALGFLVDGVRNVEPAGDRVHAAPERLNASPAVCGVLCGGDGTQVALLDVGRIVA